MKKVYLQYVSFILLFFILMTGCGPAENGNQESNGATAGKESIVTEKEPLTPDVKEITISAVGDVLIHQSVYIDAWTGNEYNFLPMIEAVEPYLSSSTITIANQESMIGGEELGLSSYPMFNSPTEVGDALKAAGVDAVVMANNHTLDRGEKAIQNAIEHWETIDMAYVGSYLDEMDREELRIIETEEGITVALLAYTYGTNGIPVPEGKDYLVDLIDREKMKEDVARAKEEADVILMNLHFGNEYERMPNEEQESLAQFAADQGVHAVIGHHPHVLQPVKWVEGEGGNETLVIYSLGNFLSNQQELYQRIGGIFTFTVEKSVLGEKEEIKLHSPQLLPTYVKFHPSWADYEVVPMFQLTDEDLAGANEHYAEMKEHMSQWMPELEFLEEE